LDLFFTLDKNDPKIIFLAFERYHYYCN